MSTPIRYREAFKKQLVDQIAKGRFPSIRKARRAYGIKGYGTVERWVRKYSREDLLPRRVRIETMKEVDELKAAKKRITEKCQPRRLQQQSGLADATGLRLPR